MTKQELLTSKIINQESIVLSKGNELFRPVIYSISFISIVFFLFVALYFNQFIFSFATFIFISSVLFLVVKNKKKYVAATIKGEFLLIKDDKHLNRITPVKSIKSISTYTFFRINYTRITYKLDGRKYKVCLLKKIDSDQMENEEILKVAMKVA